MSVSLYYSTYYPNLSLFASEGDKPCHLYADNGSNNLKICLGGLPLILNTLRTVPKVLCVALLCAGTAARTQQKPPPAVPSKPVVASAPSASYVWKVGSVYQYKVVGFFNGHIPPFAQPGSPPIHLRVELEYSATVKKQTDRGTEVSFSIENSALYLLEKEPDANGKLPQGADEALFPIPAEQVKEALDATAILSPSGSVISVSGGDSNSVKVNFGFELRKLFLLMLPVTFDEKSTSLSKDWTFEDGLLGKTPGKTLYSVHTTSSNASSATFQLTASSDIDDRRNKDDKPVKGTEEVVRTVTGKASLTGNIRFGGTSTSGRFAGRVVSANLLLKIDVLQKRLKPDPEKPEEPAEQQIDVQARLKVQEMKPAPKIPPKPNTKTP